MAYAAQAATGLAGADCAVDGGHERSGSAAAAAAAGAPSPAADPEAMGAAVAAALCDEVARGGCIPTALQPLAFAHMALTPEDVSRLRVGVIGPAGAAMLRLLRDVFGVTFRLKQEAGGAGAGAGAGADADAAAEAGSGETRKRWDAPAEGLEDVEEDRRRAPAAAVAAALAPPVAHAIDAVVAPPRSAASVLVSVLGLGYKNLAKKVT